MTAPVVVLVTLTDHGAYWAPYHQPVTPYPAACWLPVASLELVAEGGVHTQVQSDLPDSESAQVRAAKPAG